jgi:DNA polymerase-3 subunit epsilon
MSQLNLKKPIVFFDLETTGTDHVKDRIVELAFVKLLPDGKREKYVKRVNPGIPIPPEVTAIHGISDKDVADCPTFKQIAHHLFDWIKGCDLGGYNSSKFDLPLLAEEFLRVGINVDFTDRHMVDVQQIFFKMEARTLSAEADIDATIEVLEAQLDRYATLGNDVASLHQFTNNDDYVDYARRIVMKDGHPVFNFGKHKGRRVEDIFNAEPQYYDWMMQADFALHTKQKISEILNRMKLKKAGLKV